MLNIVVFEERAEAYKRALEAKFPEVVIQTATNEEKLAEFVDEMDVLLAFRIPDELVRRARRLQWIQSLATGLDYILNLPSRRKEILITSTKGIHGPQMSEIALLFMLALIRDFPRLLRNRDEGKWERWPAGLLYGKKAVILGIGVIGREIAKKCKAFGMTVYGISRVRRVVPQPTDGVDSYLGPEDLEEAASVADFLVIVAPYTPETYRIVNREILIRMKPTAFLINIGRGELVDEEALIDALKTGRIAGAALDTFVQEPLPSNHPFWSMENVIITPHVGGMSDIYVEQALSVFEENLRRFLAGERKNLINLFAE